MTTEVRIPPLGESVTEGVIVRWIRQDGDVVSADDPILELETDKATMEIPAPAAGRLRVVEAAGAPVKVGALVARIEPVAAGAGEERPGDGAAAPPAAARPAPGGAGQEGARGAPAAPEEPALSPAVRRLLAEHGLDPAAIAGSGRGGRLTKEDVLRHLERAPAAGEGPPAAQAPAEAQPAATVQAPAATRPPAGAQPSPAQPPAAAQPAVEQPGAAAQPAAERRRADVSAGAAEDEIERVPMTTLRRRIAERLVEAQHTAAILTTFNEVDCAELMAVRRRYRERFRTVHGVDLGLMSLFARAVVLALRDVPVVNARIDGDAIVHYRSVHLGIAVATPRGLVVPVVRHADRLGLADLERAIGALAERARAARLVPDDLAGGTFSITNGGIFGSLLSTPILNPPQSGILGMHRIQDRPVAVDGQVVIRPMMYVALSYDHRLVDGEQAVTFLVRVKERLEDPVRMLLEV